MVAKYRAYLQARQSVKLISAGASFCLVSFPDCVAVDVLFAGTS